jgi:enterochelin esterase-like enzyme
MPNWESFEVFLNEAEAAPAQERQAVVDALLAERLDWPWIQGDKATFIYVSMGVNSVALNLDTIETDPPFAPMQKLEGTSLWHVTGEFNQDDLLDYLLAIDDPMTPLAAERDITGRIARHWRVDPLNTTRMNTAQMNVSVLRMGHARPFPDWAKFNRVPRGKVTEHTINSMQLGFAGRKVWVYTPPGYDPASGQRYPLLVLQDGQWCVGPFQIPYMVNALIKHGRMQDVVVAMVQSGDQKDRIKTYVSNDKHYTFILTELLPFLQSQYRIDSTNLGVGGVAVGAIAAAHAALNNPAVFSHLIMISPPLGRGIAQEKLREYVGRFENAPALPRRIFQSVGRYETRTRFYLPAQVLNRVLDQRDDIHYQYVEVGSGHGLVAFRSVLPEALAWAFPGPAWN